MLRRECAPSPQRIKNATLSDSLQGGHRLIEMMFMLIVVESQTINLCPYLCLQQSGVNIEREEKCNLRSVQKAHIYEALKAS